MRNAQRLGAGRCACMPRRSRPQRWRTQVKEFVSYDDRNFFLPAVRYAHPLSDTKGTEVLDVIFKVHNGVESDNVELIRAHNAVLDHLSKQDVVVPEPLPAQGARGPCLSRVALRAAGELPSPRACLAQPCACLLACLPAPRLTRRRAGGDTIGWVTLKRLRAESETVAPSLSPSLLWPAAPPRQTRYAGAPV